MKSLIYTFLFFLQTSFAFGQELSPFETYFEDAVLRVDIHHGIDAENDLIVHDALIREPFYAGSKTRLVNDMGIGNYRYDVTDSATGMLIFSESFSDLFEEWQSTDEARSGVKKFFHESLRMPFPKNTVQLTIISRNKKGQTKTVYQTNINPLSNRIIREKPRKDLTVTDIRVKREPSKAIDILFLAEGYTAGEMDKFNADVKN